MGGGASVLAARESEAKLQASMFDVFDLLGAQAIPTTKQIATVVANAAQAIAHAGLAMLFFKVCDPLPALRISRSSFALGTLE
jgi:hypothetical protein